MGSGVGPSRYIAQNINYVDRFGTSTVQAPGTVVPHDWVLEGQSEM